jgi:hypothetical protein
MQRLGAHGARRPAGWLRTSLPPWREILVLASVALPVAASVAFFALYLVKPSHSGEIDALPDTTSERCLGQAP